MYFHLKGFLPRSIMEAFFVAGCKKRKRRCLNNINIKRSWVKEGEPRIDGIWTSSGQKTGLGNNNDDKEAFF